MAVKRKRIPRYSKVQINGHEYYKTDIEDADGKRVILYEKPARKFTIRKWQLLSKSTTPHSGVNPPRLPSIVKSGC